MKALLLVGIAAGLFLFLSCGETKSININGEKKSLSSSDNEENNKGDIMADKDVTSEEELKKKLGEATYCIMFEKATERPFSGKYDKFFEEGKYLCAACGNELFSSDTKFNSGSGWPSYFAPISEEKIKYQTDRSHGMIRTEVMCATCGGHLGHVFDDGPKPTGKRFCINSLALNFQKKEEK